MSVAVPVKHFNRDSGWYSSLRRRQPIDPAASCAVDSNGDPQEPAITVHLSTVANAKSSNRPWVNIQSAGWVRIQSAPTGHYREQLVHVATGLLGVEIRHFPPGFVQLGVSDLHLQLEEAISVRTLASRGEREQSASQQTLRHPAGCRT